MPGAPKLRPSDHRLICRLYREAEVSIRDLAGAFNVTAPAILYVLKLGGVVRRPSGTAAVVRAQHRSAMEAL